MTTGIILVIVFLIGLYLSQKSYNYEISGSLIAVFSGIYIFIHFLSISLVSYNYEIFVTHRTAFEQTLKDSRESGNELEAAAIIKEVAKYNVRLADQKYDNKTLFFDQYIDDRFEDLKPIK